MRPTQPIQGAQAENSLPDRRTFLKTVAAAGAGLALAGVAPASGDPADAPKPKLKLGFDNFSVRAVG